MTKLELAEMLGLNIDPAHKFDDNYKPVKFYMGFSDEPIIFYATTSIEAWEQATNAVIRELSLVIGERLT